MIFNPRARLIEKKKILPDLVKLRFEGENISSAALPANFVQVKVSKGLDPTFRRPMSIHSTDGNAFEMVFRTVGRGTNILAQAVAGEEYDIIGPLGNTFNLPIENEIAVMVSGGVGFPPLHFFCKYLLEKKNFPVKNIIFVMGVKTSAEKVMAEDVLKLGVDAHFSTDDGSYGFKGFATDLFEDIYSRKLRHQKIRIYSCGPAPMMKRLSQLALGFKLPCQLSLEGTMPCGVGTCLGCVVKKRGADDYHRVCYEGPVFDAEEVEL